MQQEQPGQAGGRVPSGGVDEQYRLRPECVTDAALFLVDPNGLVTSWDAGAQCLFGYAEVEIRGRSCSLLFTPEAAQAGEPGRGLRTAAAEEGTAADFWLVRQDGTRFRAGCVTTALRDECGLVRGYAVAVQDRTGLRRAEEASRDSGRRYRALVENAFDGVTLVAADGTVLEATPAAFRGLGLPPEEYVGRNAYELLHPDDAAAVRELLAAVLRQPGGKGAAQFRLRHNDGSWRWVDAVATNLLEEPGVRAVVVNHRDVTQQKEADRRKDEWLAMLAHELRGPLSPVSHAVQVLVLKAPADADLRLARDVIARQTGHLARIVDDLLEVTRLLRGLVRLRRERLDLGRLVRTAAEDYRAEAEAAGLKLAVDVPETPVWVAADATRMSQVIGNLLDNTVKFKNGGDRVAVRLAADPEHDQAVLTVRDTGVGIEPELLPVLFDVFAQADRSLNRPKGGLGLGLSLVKGLVELHGGEVRASSPGRGRGAEFTVLLPLEREPAALSADAESAGPATRRLRVLVVEDNRDSANSLRLLLSVMGHDVRVAYTGPEGVQVATEWVPEVILSDIGLPGLDGYGVASELRRRPETAEARLIAITGYGGEEDRRRALASGFDFHLTKPADLSLLKKLLAAPT